MLVLLLCFTAPTATAQSEAQRYRKIAIDTKKQGGTRADVEREYERMKAIRSGDKLVMANRAAKMKHLEKILKYWPAEDGSGAGQGAPGGSRDALNEQKVLNVLQDLARSSNEKVIARSEASSIDEMKENARGEMDHEIPVDPNVSNRKNPTNMDASELLGIVESSNGESPQARQSERGRDSLRSTDDMLTDDFMGAKSVSADSFVNDIPVSEYEKAVEHWAREMEKYPNGSSDRDWARANYEDAVMRLNAKKAAVQQAGRAEKNLDNWARGYKAKLQSEKKNKPKTSDKQESKGNPKAYGNVKVNGMGVSMPQSGKK